MILQEMWKETKDPLGKCGHSILLDTIMCWTQWSAGHSKMHLLNPLTPLIQKTNILQKNAWSNFYCIFYEESFAENPVKIKLKIKFFHIIRNWISPPPTTLTPFSSKTVKDRENLLTYYRKVSLRRIKCKKPHQNRIKNKNFLQNCIF